MKRGLGEVDLWAERHPRAQPHHAMGNITWKLQYVGSVLPEAGVLQECAWLVLFLLSLNPDSSKEYPLKASLHTR